MNQIIKDLQSDTAKNAELKKRGYIVYGLLLLFVFLQFASLVSAEVNLGFLKAVFSDFKNVQIVFMGFLGFSLLYHMPVAAPYIKRLYEALSIRISTEEFFHTYCEQSGEAGGLFYDNVPDDYISGAIGYYEHSYRENVRYVFGGFFSRSFLYVWSLDGLSVNKVYKNILSDIGLSAYLTSLWYEAKHQISGLFTHRENSDVLGPYIASVICLFALCWV